MWNSLEGQALRGLAFGPTTERFRVVLQNDLSRLAPETMGCNSPSAENTSDRARLVFTYSLEPPADDPDGLVLCLIGPDAQRQQQKKAGDSAHALPESVLTEVIGPGWRDSDPRPP
jgi:hypothetical protein